MVDHRDARRIRQGGARLFGRDGVFELDRNGFGVTDEYRDTDAGCGDLDLGIQNLLGLDHHLPFLLGVAVFHEDVDVRNDVEGDGLGERLHVVVFRLVHEDAAGLIEQFVHAFLAGAGRRLIGRDDNPRDIADVVQRFQRHHHLDGRAVGVGDDVLPGIAGDGLRIDLRHHQRNVRVHPEVGRIVDDDRAGGRGAGREVRRDFRAGAGQHDVGSLEVEPVETGNAQHVVLAKRHLDADGALGRERGHVVRTHPALGKDLQHFVPDGARGADDRVLDRHGPSPVRKA